MARRITERSAACATCGKTFARSDTLLRHEKSHQSTEDRGPVHRVTNGTFRACSSCAQARSRCSGGMPCGRCKTRKLNCSYPSKRRKGAAVNDDVDGQNSFNTIDHTNDNQRQPSKSPYQLQAQFQQFVFSTPSNLLNAENGQTNAASANAVSAQPHPNQTQPKPQQSDHAHVNFHTNLPHATTDTHSLSAADASLQGISSMQENINNQGQYANSGIPMDYNNAFGHENAAFGNNNLSDESLSLNWIPVSVFPSPYGDIEHDFSFFLPSYSDSASLVDPMAFDPAAAVTPQSRVGGGTLDRQPAPYRIPASISGLMQSPASTGSDNIAPVGFAFENVDIPGSKKKRRKALHVTTDFKLPREAKTEFAFPDTSTVSTETGVYLCSEDKYKLVYATFQRLCLNSSRWKTFSDATFPSLSAFNAYIDLYFENLHRSFPLLHAPTFEQNSDWLTCLACAAIGSTFTSIPDCADAREAFQEFLRRAVLATSDEHDGDFRNIHLAQARNLALLGLAQSDREQLRSRAPRSHADLARWCLESSILQLTARDEDVRSNEDITAAWHRWIQRESLRRVGYMIWLLDCALGYIGNARPLCNMDDARAPLPCAEALWDAASAPDWLVHRNNMPQMPSLCKALEDMYNKKQVDPSFSEISNILLIHALYSRTWEVGTHIKQPMSEWKATGNARGFLNTPTKDDFWLPLYPLYANWRNSACDCLDVLQWQATAMMARNSGAEHHGVLHLHLARVILLTPFQEIQDLLFFLINYRVSELSKASFYVHDGSYQPRNPTKLPLIRKITWRWLREDQHKARLAMIHAGSVFWHVRRYSTNSFFEPLAIYLASIVLWTYGSYKSAALDRDTSKSQPSYPNPNPNQQSPRIQAEPGTDSNIQPTRIERSYISSRSHSLRNEASRSSSHSHSPTTTRQRPPTQSPMDSPTSPSTAPSDDEQPTFIYLDRPCDDEIVQHFVRNGHNMSGYMSNVGDICATPGKVLIEGAKILRTRLASWGVSREYHDILTRLAEMRKDKDIGGQGKGKTAEKKGASGR